MLADTRAGRRRALVEAVTVLALAGAAWVLYGPVLRLWWMHDDVFHLRSLLTRRAFWYVFDPWVYGEQPARVLTPLHFLSIDLDRRLFGFDPRPFYLHHLAALSVCAAALYGVLRLWLARSWAVVAVWIFLIGPVTASLASMLAVRHYLETLVLAALSVVAWTAALRRLPEGGAWGFACLSAALYFMACMAKEIAVPFVVLLPLLPAPDARLVGIRERIRLAVPHAAAFAIYLGLRYMLLGTLVTAYGFAVRPRDLPALALALPAKIAAEFVGGRVSATGVVFALTLAAGVSMLLVLGPRRRAAALTGVAMLLAALPVLPVSTLMEPRFAAAAWLVTAVVFALGCRRLAAAEPGSLCVPLAIVLAVVACAAGLWMNRQDWRVRFAQAERTSAENRFVLEMSEGDVLRRPLAIAATLGELAWMKEAVFQRPRGGRWFQDDLFLCLHPDPLGRVWGYEAAARRVIELTARIPPTRDRFCASIRAEAPLTASFRMAGTDLFWELGPYSTGTYRFVLEDGGQVVDVPGRAGFQMRRWQSLPALRIGYESPAGWVTYSPVLHLRLVDGWSLRWSRPSIIPSTPSSAP